MLDADASFRPDPEVPAPLLTDPATPSRWTGQAAPPPPPAPRDSLPTESLPEAASPPGPAHPVTATAAPADADLPSAPAEDAEDGGSDPRPVTPRRLLRLTSARAAEDAPIHALPVLNLFTGIFDEDEDLTDPRLMRSRARARCLLAAHEAGLSDAERNLWHDDPQPEPAATPAPAEPEPQGRRIRHLTAADIAPLPPEPVQDPLRDRLHAARDALYTPHPDDPPPVPQQGLATRLCLQAMTALLLVLAWPAGLLLATATVLRGGDLRLTARTVALAGTATALLKVAPLLLT